VRAPKAVLAVNAWAVGWRSCAAAGRVEQLHRAGPLLRLRNWKAINWTGGELVTDFRTSVRYFRTTRDRPGRLRGR